MIHVIFDERFGPTVTSMCLRSTTPGKMLPVKKLAIQPVEGLGDEYVTIDVKGIRYVP